MEDLFLKYKHELATSEALLQIDPTFIMEKLFLAVISCYLPISRHPRILELLFHGFKVFLELLDNDIS
jgi:hypothetical protein